MPRPKEAEAVTSEITLQGLTAMLDRHGINHKLWGITPGSKPIGKLLKELQDGDSRLVNTPEGKLIREVEQVGVFVFAGDLDGNFYVLKEDRQEFADGRVRKRGMEGVSFREKLNLTTEGFNAALERGMEEELPEIYKHVGKSMFTSLSNQVLRVDSYRPPVILEESADYKPSFPGLPNRSMEYRYTILIPHSAFKLSGYVTAEKDKKTFFVWEHTSPENPHLPATVWNKMGERARKEFSLSLQQSPNRNPQVPVQIYTEHLLLSTRSRELAAGKQMEYGDKNEIEYAVTNFRIFELEKLFPELKK